MDDETKEKGSYVNPHKMGTFKIYLRFSNGAVTTCLRVTV
jgi:hypothetical protein